MLGVESLQDESDRAQKLRQREEAAVAASMGWPEVDGGDDMRQTVLGDNIQNITAPPQKPSGLGMLAKIGIGAALIGSGAGIPAGISFIADALKAKPPVVPVVQPVTVDTVGGFGFDD